MEGTNCCSVADMAAIMNGNNQGMNWNSPMWLIWAMLFGNGGFGGWNRNGEATMMANSDINGQLNAIRQTMADNQNTNSLSNGIAGNHEALNANLGAINMGFAGTNANINQASMTNALGQKDAQAQMASCCCDIKSNILNQTNQLQSQIAQLANGVQTGFANIGFLTQQQTNELNTNANANTQRIIDTMSNHWQSDLQQRLADAKLELSQQQQNATLIAALKTA